MPCLPNLYARLSASLAPLRRNPRRAAQYLAQPALLPAADAAPAHGAGNGCVRGLPTAIFQLAGRRGHAAGQLFFRSLGLYAQRRRPLLWHTTRLVQCCCPAPPLLVCAQTAAD